jgi:hypothetical protein
MIAATGISAGHITSGVLPIANGGTGVSAVEPDFNVPPKNDPSGNGFTNGWDNFGGYDTVGYFKDPFGVVHLKGSATAPTPDSLGKPMFTLKPGYRPAARKGYGIASEASGGTFTLCEVDIKIDGTVFASSPCSPYWIPLDGLSFRAAPQQ